MSQAAARRFDLISHARGGIAALIGGAVTGALVAGVLIGLRHWPGGFWTAWAAQYIVITLIAGFS